MKKIVILLIVIAGGYFAYNLYQRHLFKNHDKSSFIQLTGITNFKILAEVNESQYCYVKAIVSPGAKQMLLAKHYYRPLPLILRGHKDCNYKFTDTEHFEYYLDDAAHGNQSYTLYLISTNDNTVVVYQDFGD